MNISGSAHKIYKGMHQIKTEVHIFDNFTRIKLNNHLAIRPFALMQEHYFHVKASAKLEYFPKKQEHHDNFAIGGN